MKSPFIGLFNSERVRDNSSKSNFMCLHELLHVCSCPSLTLLKEQHEPSRTRELTDVQELLAERRRIQSPNLSVAWHTLSLPPGNLFILHFISFSLIEPLLLAVTDLSMINLDFFSYDPSLRWVTNRNRPLLYLLLVRHRFPWDRRKY